MAAQEKTNTLLETFVLRLGAILAALVVFGLFVKCAQFADPQRKGPIEVFQMMYTASFGSWFSFKITLTKAAPLILTALCVALPARLGLIVIGAEGALVMGALASAAISIPMHDASPMALLIAMGFAGAVAGGLWIMMVGALRHFRGVNETICGLLLNYIAIDLLKHFVEGSLKDPTSLNKPATPSIPDASSLGTIPGLDVHWGLAFGVIFCIIAYFILQHTTFGFAVRTTGGNIRAAKIVGLPVGLLILLTTFAAGAAAGLAGMVEVAAVHKNANAAIVCGYGYAGILVSFIALHNPLAIIPVAILLGAINASSGMLQRRGHLPDATVLVLQGILFVVILTSETLFGRFAIFKSKPAVEKPKAPPVLPTNLEGAAHG